jgi:hypothetical protein
MSVITTLFFRRVFFLADQKKNFRTVEGGGMDLKKTETKEGYDVSYEYKCKADADFPKTHRGVTETLRDRHRLESYDRVDTECLNLKEKHDDGSKTYVLSLKFRQVKNVAE